MLNIVALSRVRDTFRLGYLVTVVGYFVFPLMTSIVMIEPTSPID